MKTEKRRAEVGERILIVNPDDRTLKTDDIYKVSKAFYTYVHTEEGCMVNEWEYEVITGDETEEEPEWVQTMNNGLKAVANTGISVEDLLADEEAEERIDILINDLVDVIEYNSKKMKEEWESEHSDYSYARYLQGKDAAYRDILEMLEGEDE